VKPILYHYGITRFDVPPIVRAVQVFHAAGESAGRNLPQGTYARLLQAGDENALKAVAWELFKAGVQVRLVYEPDAPWFGQLMALGLEPVLAGTKKYRSVREITRKLERLSMDPTALGEVAQRAARAPANQPEVGGSNPSLSANFHVVV
jgi:hypothetical protein